MSVAKETKEQREMSCACSVPENRVEQLSNLSLQGQSRFSKTSLRRTSRQLKIGRTLQRTCIPSRLPWSIGSGRQVAAIQ